MKRSIWSLGWIDLYMENSMSLMKKCFLLMRYHQLPILLLQNLSISYCCVKQFHNFYRLETVCECIYKLDVFIQGREAACTVARESISLGAEVCGDAMHKYQRPALCCRLVEEQPGGQQPLLIMSKLIIHDVCSCSTISRFLGHIS